MTPQDDDPTGFGISVREYIPNREAEAIIQIVQWTLVLLAFVVLFAITGALLQLFARLHFLNPPSLAIQVVKFAEWFAFVGATVGFVFGISNVILRDDVRRVRTWITHYREGQLTARDVGGNQPPEHVPVIDCLVHIFGETCVIFALTLGLVVIGGGLHVLSAPVWARLPVTLVTWWLFAIATVRLVLGTLWIAIRTNIETVRGWLDEHRDRDRPPTGDD